MTLLERLLRHDQWTTQQLLELCRRLSSEQLDREFDIGHRSVRATLVHMIFNIEAWADSMAGRPIRREQACSVPDLFKRLEIAYGEFGNICQAVDARDGCDEVWTDAADGRQRTYGGTIAHVITHSMHHRAQLLYLLRLLGVENLPEGDVLSWEEQSESA